MRDSYYGANRSLNSYGRSEDLTYNTGLQYKAFLENSSIIAGVEITGGVLKDTKLGYPDYDNAVVINDSIVSVPHTDNTLVSDQVSVTPGAFLQYDLKINKLKLGFGARLDNYRIIDNANNNEAKRGTVFSPRISLLYELHPSPQSRISYSQGYRAPQIFDEDLHIETSGSRQVINVNDPDEGELRESAPFSDLGAKIQYNIKINGATSQLYTGIKNIFNSYQSDFDSGIDRDPAYMYGPMTP